NLPVTTGPSAAREDRGAVPKVNGPEPGEKAKALFTALRAGAVNRAELGDEFSILLTEAKMRAASVALKPFGTPSGATVRSVGERGGMEVSSVRLTFASGAPGNIDALMYRSPDGRVQEY